MKRPEIPGTLRNLAWPFAAAVLLVSLGGCIPSYPVGPGEMDRYWSLHPDVTAEAPYHQPDVGGRKLPARWVIRQRKSIVWSTVSIVRAVDRMKKGPEEIEFSVSPMHANALADTFLEIRMVLEDLAKVAEDARSDRRGWARTLADALVQVEQVTRITSIEEGERTGDDARDPLGLPAGPLLKMVALYLNERTEGSLLAELGPGQIDQLREVLTQLILRMGFAAAGKHQPEGLRESITGKMREAERLDALHKSMEELLTDQLDRAGPASSGQELKTVLRVALSGAPKALEVLEAIVRQWDRMEAVEFEFRRRGDRLVVAATLRVLPGKEVRLAGMVIAQPVIAFRGASRITVIPEAPSTGETVVTFEPVGEGAVEMRFEGWIYGLVRLFALPLASGALREVRVFRRSQPQGSAIVNVAVLMETASDKTDPRRLMVFQDARRKRIRREAFSVRSVADKTEQVFSYITPNRRYTYRRVKTPPQP